jgi:hypothetical protein
MRSLLWGAGDETEVIVRLSQTTLRTSPGPEQRLFVSQVNHIQRHASSVQVELLLHCPVIPVNQEPINPFGPAPAESTFSGAGIDEGINEEIKVRTNKPINETAEKMICQKNKLANKLPHGFSGRI